MGFKANELKSKGHLVFLFKKLRFFNAREGKRFGFSNLFEAPNFILTENALSSIINEY